MNVSTLRANTTDSIWRMTNRTLVLEHVNWTRDVATMLRVLNSRTYFLFVFSIVLTSTP